MGLTPSPPFGQNPYFHIFFKDDLPNLQLSFSIPDSEISFKGKISIQNMEEFINLSIRLDFRNWGKTVTVGGGSFYKIIA